MNNLLERIKKGIANMTKKQKGIMIGVLAFALILPIALLSTKGSQEMDAAKGVSPEIKDATEDANNNNNTDMEISDKRNKEDGDSISGNDKDSKDKNDDKDKKPSNNSELNKSKDNKPSKSNKPSKPSKPSKSNKPSKPSNKPSKPGNKPSKPSNKPSKPSKPSKPGNKPSKPDNKPSKPSKPNKPSKPSGRDRAMEKKLSNTGLFGDRSSLVYQKDAGGKNSTFYNYLKRYHNGSISRNQIANELEGKMKWKEEIGGSIRSCQVLSVGAEQITTKSTDVNTIYNELMRSGRLYTGIEYMNVMVSWNDSKKTYTVSALAIAIED